MIAAAARTTATEMSRPVRDWGTTGMTPRRIVTSRAPAASTHVRTASGSGFLGSGETTLRTNLSHEGHSPIGCDHYILRDAECGNVAEAITALVALGGVLYGGWSLRELRRQGQMAQASKVYLEVRTRNTLSERAQVVDRVEKRKDHYRKRSRRPGASPLAWQGIARHAAEARQTAAGRSG